MKEEKETSRHLETTTKIAAYMARPRLRNINVANAWQIYCVLDLIKNYILGAAEVVYLS